MHNTPNELESQLRHKDEKIAKVKTFHSFLATQFKTDNIHSLNNRCFHDLQLKLKKKELKRKVHDLQEVNSDLELQIQQLNSQLSQLLVSKTSDELDGLKESTSNPQQDQLRVLEKRIASQISDDGVSV